MTPTATLGVAGVLSLVLGSPAQAADRTLVAHPVATWQGAADAPLILPTAVALGLQGTVYVADGVNDRVLQLDRNGQILATIEIVDGLHLSNPTGLATTADGWLWIADTGNGRAACLAPPPGLDSSLRPPTTLAARPDLTGVAVSPDGSTVWLVDNDGHQLLRSDLGLGTWQRVGGLGDGLGQLHHPFLAAADAQGQVWVSDVINGRVEAYAPTGDALRTVGGFGVTPGELYRPKGVAIGDELIWVTDSVLGVVQAFTPGGRLVDVLRDEAGNILHLDAPAGLAVEGDRMLVVELGANQVTELRVSREVGRPYSSSGASLGGGESTGCSSCHIEMIPAMSRGVGNLLAPMPRNTTDAPWVGSDRACLSCHDGSVLDSRREVWHLHGHPLEVEIPSDMQIPEDLPLSGGQMGCRTCHSAHTLGGSGQVHRNALMLRVTDRPVELCTACHGDMQGGGDR